jgi:hypothetical protein
LKHQKRTITKPALAFVLAISALPALAQEAGGVFTGTLNGTPITCPLWPMQSDFLRSGNTLFLNIMTNRCEGIEGEGQISLSFEQTSESIGAVEIRLFGQTDGPNLYGKTDTGAMVELLSASEEGDFLTLSGAVSAQIGPSEDRGSTIDMSAPQALEVNFSGVIGRLTF